MKFISKWSILGEVKISFKKYHIAILKCTEKKEFSGFFCKDYSNYVNVIVANIILCNTYSRFEMKREKRWNSDQNYVTANYGTIRERMFPLSLNQNKWRTSLEKKKEFQFVFQSFDLSLVFLDVKPFKKPNCFYSAYVVVHKFVTQSS